MAIQFYNNQNGTVLLEKLNCGDTFIYEGRLGLVADLRVVLNDGYESEIQRFYIDLTTGEDFLTKDKGWLDIDYYVTPVNIEAKRI